MESRTTNTKSSSNLKVGPVRYAGVVRRSDTSQLTITIELALSEDSSVHDAIRLSHDLWIVEQMLAELTDTWEMTERGSIRFSDET
jgi:hypothetical protein